MARPFQCEQCGGRLYTNTMGTGCIEAECGAMQPIGKASDTPEAMAELYAVELARDAFEYAHRRSAATRAIVRPRVPHTCDGFDAACLRCDAIRLAYDILADGVF